MTRAEGLVLRRFTLTEITQQSNSYMLLAVSAFLIAATAWLIKSLAEAFVLQKELRNCRFGLRGEQAVAEALNDRAVSTAGYIVFHDVPGDGQWNIDHVIIGAGGVFVLETKARSRRKSRHDQQEDHEVLFDGERLKFPWCDDDESIKQAVRNADWVRRFIKGFGPKDIPVQSIVVVPGWYVKAQGKHAVKVMNATYLASNYLPSVQRRFRAEELTAIVRRFDERCRDLEF